MSISGATKQPADGWYRTSEDVGSAFALACQGLAAEARRSRVRGRLRGASGELLAEVDAQGSFMAVPTLTAASPPPADGWYRTAEDVVCYVHEGRPFSLRCGQRLVVARLKMLPKGSLAVAYDEVDAFQQAGAELIAAFYATGEE